VTALFADIKGSMELMEDLDPEEARAIVDPALKLMIDAVHHYGGYVVQSTGDGIFALFGAPVAHEDHPQRALYAALRLQEEMQRYSGQLRQSGNLPIEARVGVNTGEVVVRSIATGDNHPEYTPIGHSTSLAARMQALAPTGSIAATDGTRKLCEGYFTFRTLGPARVKGVSEPVAVFEVTGRGPLRTRLQVAAQRGLTRFVGRQAELEQMKHALELARVGHGQIVAVMGEPGVGKSRLFFEFKAVAQSGCLVLEGCSDSRGKAAAYLPVIDLLKGYFEILPGDDERKRREKIAGKIVMLDRALEDTLPYLFGLLGIVEDDDPLAQLDPQLRRRRTLEAVKRILLRESMAQPLIVIFEDLHWLDSESQALLNLIVEGIATARLLLLVNYRPEYRHQWGGKTYYSQLRLDPLGRESAEQMLMSLLGQPVPLARSYKTTEPALRSATEPRPGGQPAEALSMVEGDEWGKGEGSASEGAELAPLKRLIIERTEGNPFFMEEMIQALFEQGVLVRNGTVRLAKQLDEIRVPPTVQAMLASRIDRLPAREKELLQSLAVLGREFPSGLIKRVTAKPDAELERMLSRLQVGEFIYEQAAIPDVEYTFKHALTQEVAYNSVLIERRRLLHERTAQAIEELFADRLEEHLTALAHHFEHSGNVPKAVEYLGRTGTRAARQIANSEAIGYFTRALELLQRLPEGAARDSQELDLQMALNWSLFVAVGLRAPERESALVRARQLCEQLGDNARLMEVLLAIAHLHLNQDDLQPARELAERVITMAQEANSSTTLAGAHYILGIVLFFTGQFPTARGHFERTVELFGAGPYRGYAAFSAQFAANVLLAVLTILGYPSTAHSRAQDLLAAARRSSDPYLIANTLYNDGMRHINLRDTRMAAERADELLSIATEYGMAFYSIAASFFRGWAMAAAGRGEEGIAEMRRSISEASPGVMVHALAETCGKNERAEEGLDLVSQGLAAVEQTGRRMAESELHRLRGELLMIKDPGNMVETERCLRIAIDVARRQEAKWWELRATVSLARLLRDTGRRDEARAMLSEIYNWFTEGFDTADLKDAKALLDELSN
jgi:class 3 adenylate cyclase/tetratricopeptide (TPR) repeat protein